MDKVAITVAGVGLIALGCYSFKHLHQYISQNIAVSRQTLSKSYSCPASFSYQNKKVTEKTMTRINTIENKFFIGMNKKASLSDEDLEKLKSSVLCLAPDVEISPNVRTFQDLLVSLRNGKFLRPTDYESQMKKVFSEAGMEMNEGSWHHLKLLGETVLDLIEEDLRDQDVDSPWKYDIILLYSDKDDALAKEFYSACIANVKIQDLRIAMSDDIGQGEGEIRGWQNAFDLGIYIFILVSCNFSDDDIKRYTGEVNLLESLRNHLTRWRVVPVWMERGIKDSKSCPFELSGIQGLKYYLYQEDSHEKRIFYTTEDLIKKGREKYRHYFSEKCLKD